MAGLVLTQLAGCAAGLWPPSARSLSVDLPFAHPPATAPEPIPPPVMAGPAPLNDPTNVSEALAYAEALCNLPPAELTAEIERLKIINAQDGHTALHAQQLAFAQQLAQLYGEQARLQESNERQAQLLRERQRHIEQLNGQIEAMRAVEYSLPAASTSAVPTPATTTSPVAPFPPATPTGRSGAASPPAPASSPKAAIPMATPSSPAASPPAAGNGDKGAGDAATRSAHGEEASPKVGEDTAPSPQH